MRLAPALILLAPLLAGWGSCTRRAPPPPQVVYVTVEKLVPVPDALTAPCQNEAPREQTAGEAKRLANVRGLYLDECTGRMAEIRALGR
jgi:hypothetical protein